jgi:hypothetical protein
LKRHDKVAVGGAHVIGMLAEELQRLAQVGALPR